MPKFKFKQVNYSVTLAGVSYDISVHPEHGSPYVIYVMPQDKFVWYFFNEIVNKFDNPEWDGVFNIRKISKKWVLTYELDKPTVEVLEFKRFPSWAVKHEY